MSELRSRTALFAVLLLGACTTGESGVLNGRSPVLGVAGNAGAEVGAASFAPLEPAAQVTDTGTAVGARVTKLQNDLASLQGSIAQNTGQLQSLRAETVQDAEAYFEIVATINAKLQVGTTPGNPVLVSRWGDAQVKLDEISGDVARMNALSGNVASDSTVAAYLLESVRATYGLAGAVDDDHRQLAILEDEVNRSVVLIDRLLNDLSQDINRQTAYLANARSDLQALQVAISNGELYGSSLANRAYFSAAPLPATGREVSPASVSPSANNNRPLVIIRFDRPNVEYRQAVYQAVSEALDRRPDSRFALVSVSPSEGEATTAARAANTARDNAEDVKRTLVTLGLPADRITLSSSRNKDVAGPEVHIFVR
jgi:TolA-binding protein